MQHRVICDNRANQVSLSGMKLSDSFLSRLITFRAMRLELDR